MKFTIHVPAIPVAMPRPRATIRGDHAAVYQPTKHHVNDFKASVRMAAREAYSGPPLQGPLSVSIEFVFPRPLGLFWKTKEMPRIRHTKKPDRDNVDKAVLDSLKGLMWRDDKQVCDGRLTKWIASGYEQPGVTIVIEELT